MKRILSLCLLIAVLLLPAHALTSPPAERANPDSDPPDRIGETIFHDFETGELFGWEPYPYQQDTGYDALFFTRQSPTFNDSNYAIARPVNAHTTAELYHGFTRRIDLWTTSDTRLQAAVFFQGDRDPEKLEVALGTFDGRLFTYVIENPAANRWLEIDIPASDFRDGEGNRLGSGEHLQVVKLEGSYPQVYYLFTYTILMDDFRLNGERQRRFVAVEPESSHFEKFGVSVLNRHYHYGETMSLSVVPEENVQLERVRGELVDSNGEVVRSNVRFERRGERWTSDSVHRFSRTDARGQWKLRLVGERPGGGQVHWSFRFLVPGDPVEGHPRLFFTADELADRLENRTSPVARRILENALSNTAFMEVDLDAIEEGVDRTGEALTGGPWSGWRENFNAWNQPMSRLGNVIREGSFRYAFTGDRAAGEKAKEALLKLCSFEKWNNNWMLGNQFWTYYPVGYALKPVAYAYDMINDLLSEEEKAFVREAIMEKGLRHFHRDMVEMNRMPSNNTNHIAVLVSGHGLAAAAIYGEDPDKPWMEPYLSGIMTKALTFIERAYYEDGSYGEPFSYQAMASRSLIEIMDVFERNFGVDWSTTTPMRNFQKYPIQVTDSEGRGHLGFGDGSVNLNQITQVHGQWFVHRTGNPYVYNYVKPFWEEGNGGYMGFLYFRDDIEPIARETLPTSRVFGAQGIVMRSGWEPESTIITTKVGPHSNHFHFDQGTFQVMTNGENLLYDLAHSGGYYENLEFYPYNIQPISKNVMLLDGDSESQIAAHFDNGIAALSDWPRMTFTFTGEIADAVENDLATVYKGKLDHYTRTMLYTKSGPLFLFDRVRSVSDEGHSYNWLFHSRDLDNGDPSISLDGDRRVLIDRPRARMTIDVVSPDLASASIVSSSFDESFARLDSRKKTGTEFLAVLWPEPRPERGSAGLRPVTEAVTADGWIGARTEKGGSRHIGLFRSGQAGTDRVEGFRTDAQRLTASFDGGTLASAWFQGSRLEGHGLSLTTDRPVAAAVAPDGSGKVLEVKNNEPVSLTISLQSRPDSVELDGERFREWEFGNGRLTLRLPAGRHDITIR